MWAISAKNSDAWLLLPNRLHNGGVKRAEMASILTRRNTLTDLRSLSSCSRNNARGVNPAGKVSRMQCRSGIAPTDLDAGGDKDSTALNQFFMRRKKAPYIRCVHLHFSSCRGRQGLWYLNDGIAMMRFSFSRVSVILLKDQDSLGRACRQCIVAASHPISPLPSKSLLLYSPALRCRTRDIACRVLDSFNSVLEDLSESTLLFPPLNGLLFDLGHLPGLQIRFERLIRPFVSQQQLKVTTNHDCASTGPA